MNAHDATESSRREGKYKAGCKIAVEDARRLTPDVNLRRLNAQQQVEQHAHEVRPTPSAAAPHTNSDARRMRCKCCCASYLCVCTSPDRLWRIWTRRAAGERAGEAVEQWCRGQRRGAHLARSPIRLSPSTAPGRNAAECVAKFGAASQSNASEHNARRDNLAQTTWTTTNANKQFKGYGFVRFRRKSFADQQLLLRGSERPTIRRRRSGVVADRASRV